LKRLSIKLLSLVVLAMPLIAGTTVTARPLPNFNAQSIAAPAPDLALSAKLQQSARASGLSAPIANLHVDERLGVPNLITFVAPKAATAAAMAFAAKNTPEQAARTHLKSVANLYQISADGIDAAPLKYVDSAFQGGYLVAFDHQLNGIEIFRESVAVLMNANMQPLAIRGQLGPTQSGEAILAKKADKNAASAAASGYSSVSSNVFQLSPQQAIAAAMGDYGFTGAIGLAIYETNTGKQTPEYRATGSGSVNLVNNPYRTFNMPLGMVSEERARMGDDARVKQVWFRVGQELVAAYYIELDMSDSPFGQAVVYSYVIAADDGRMLFRNNLTSDVAFSYRLWAEKGGINLPYPGPNGRGSTPHPTGKNDGFQPPYIAPNDITLQNGPISTNDPWLLADATKTIGNNVEAWANRLAPTALPPSTVVPADLFEVGLDECNIASTAIGDFHACTSGPNAFLYTYDLTKGPVVSRAQSVASVVNMFYVVNWLHDWYYDAGFKEVHGNAQTSNYERGGLGNDSIRAQGQDIAGFDNANMSTPADGGRPRMRMYIFKGKGGAAVISDPTLRRVSAGASFGPTGFDLNGTLTLGDDGVAPGGDACTAFPTPLTGLIVLVDRGTCSFKTKTRNAQLAGAVGIVIANNVDGNPIALGEDTAITDAITIPALMVTLADGVALKARLKAETVRINLVRVLGVDRDGTLDNSVIAHEWGHYISNRLIGNANGIGTNQAGGLGEGWADFHAQLMAVKAEDAQVASNANFGGVYNTVAAYDEDGPQIPGLTLSQAHYSGFRRYPSSIDMAKNPLTLKHIETGVPLPSVPVPLFAGNNAEVHNTGEVWSAMLWGCYASMLRDTARLTFDQAQERMKRYIVASYKLTPNDPTIIEARDALFAAIGANDQNDLKGCREAFAVRGAGVFARVGPRTSPTNEGVVESFFAVVPANFPGLVQLTQSTQTVLEGNAAVVTVSRTDGSFGEVSVSYATSSGTAIAGVDYTEATGTVTWANGDTTNKTFTVLTTADTVAEAPETFTVTLSNPVNATLGGPLKQVVSLVDPGVFPENCAIPAGWTKPTAATAGWIVATDTRYDGLCSLKSAPIGNSAKSQIQFSGNFKAGNVTFARRVSSENGFDCLRFLIDGAEQAINGGCADVGGIGASGEVPWGLVNVPISAGAHTLVWSYEKDAGAIEGADAAWIDAVSLPIAAATAPAANYSDMWWAGSAENGWGMSIQQHSNGVQFNALYVYDAAGQPRWYVMPGGAWNADFTAYTGALYQPSSAPFTNYNKAQFVVGASVGSATITFTGTGSATLAYTISGVTGSKAIQRQSFSGGTAPFNVGDLWWFGSAEDGWGINFAQQAGTIFGVWYTYGADGKNTWFVLPGGTWTANAYAGPLYSTIGSPWLGTAYNPSMLQVNAVGTLSINFSSANAATMTYTFNAGAYNGTTQTKAIVRQTF
jgi:Fungalysin metallopeptidase (M36)/Calx-beta domain/PA domain